MKNAKKTRIQQEKTARIPDAIVFIHKRRSQGVAEQAIVDELVSNGWNQFEAVKIVDTTPRASAQKKEHHWKIAVILLVVFAAAIGGIFYWFVLYASNPKMLDNFNNQIEELKEYLANSNLDYESNGKDVVVNTNVGSEIIRAAAIVDGSVISYNDFISDLATMKYFYSAQSDTIDPPSDVLLSKQILTRLIRQQYLTDATAELGLTPTVGEIDAEYVKLISLVGSSDELEQQIRELYNWSTIEFKSKALSPYLSRRKMTEYLMNDETFNKSAKDKIETIQKLLNTTDKTFEELADLYSEDTEAKAGGDLGLISKGDTIAEFEDVAFSLEDGQVSGIVSTDNGFHLIKTVSRSIIDVANEQIRVEHIFVRKNDVDDWVIEQLRDKVVSLYINDFQWMDSCGFALSTFETCESNELVQTFSNDFNSVDFEALKQRAANINANTNQ